MPDALKNLLPSPTELLSPKDSVIYVRGSEVKIRGLGNLSVVGHGFLWATLRELILRVWNNSERLEAIEKRLEALEKRMEQK